MIASLTGLILLAASTRVASPSRTTPTVWFDVGHRIIARIAERRLTEHTLAAVREILGGQSLAEASLWADQIRATRRDTGPLHYVNIPLEAERYDPARDCLRGRCIIAAIETYSQVLRNPSAKPAERAEALRFVIHFIGDLHQPLHVSNNNDRGGNLTQVQFNGRGTNLHAVWDGELYQSKWPDEDSYFQFLLKTLDGLEAEELSEGTVLRWALDGLLTARDAYQFPRSRRLGDDYVDRHLPEVDLALISAGVRLARILNEALESYRVTDTATSAVSRSPGDRSYTDVEAAAHSGERAVVSGVVVTVRRVRSGNIFINFGKDYPNQTFTGAILNPRDPRLLELDFLVGKRVGIRGIIQIYKGQPEILITSRDQIEVME